MRVIAHDVLFEAPVRRAGRTLVAALPLALGIGLVFGWAAVARALRPLDELEKAAARLEATSPLALGVNAKPLELARLERAFDGLLGRIGAALAAERGFTQEASHELRTPLTVVRAHVERCLRSSSPQERENDLRSAIREIDALEAVVESLLLLARSDGASMRLEPVNLCDLARSVARQRALIDIATVSPVEVEAPDEILVRGSEDMLGRAIGNLVENARKFAGPAGRVRVRVLVEGAAAVLTVADDGPGIPEASRPHVFDRFFRDPAQRETSVGAGLGLAVVRAVVVRHGGTVSAGASDLGGAELRVEIPLLT